MNYLLPEQQLEKWKDEHGDIVFNGNVLPYDEALEKLTYDYISGLYFAILKYCYGNIFSLDLYMHKYKEQRDSDFYSSDIEKTGQRTARFKHFKTNYLKYFL